MKKSRFPPNSPITKPYINTKKGTQPMKNLTKFASLLLALVMVFALTTTAFAAEGDAGTITITNAKKGETYNLYKIFDLTWDGNSAYAYYLPENSQWEDFFTGTGAGATYFTIDAASGLATPTNALNDSSVKTLADAMMAYIATEGVTVTPVETITPTEDGSIVFDELGYGYYMIDTTTGTVCVLNSNTKNLSLTDKTLIPTVDKKVKEDDTGNWGDEGTAAIGQTVNFQATIEHIYKSENVVFHDTMSTGLTYTGVTSVQIKASSSAALTDVPTTAYTVTTTPTDGCTFEISFTDEYLHSLTDASAYIVVEYAAKLNENAVVTDPTAAQMDSGNTNGAQMSYGDKQTSTKDEVTVRTWPLKIFKYTGDIDNNPTALAGAKFVFAKIINSSEGTQWAFVKSVGEGNKPTGTADGWIIVNTTAGQVPEVPEGAFEFTSDSNGMINLNGLDSPDQYVLIETQAPAGYNALTEPIYFTINMTDNNSNNYHKGYIRVNNGTVEYSQINIENKTGSVLPTTGGMGTTMIYAVGGVLVLAAIVLLVTKKRMRSAK